MLLLGFAFRTTVVSDISGFPTALPSIGLLGIINNADIGVVEMHIGQGNVSGFNIGRPPFKPCRRISVASPLI